MVRKRALATSGSSTLFSELMRPVAILCAMALELQSFQEQLELQKEPQCGAFPCFTGRYADKQLLLVQTGIGKVHAAAAAQYVCSRYEPEAMLSCGSAGGLDERCRVGDIVVALMTVQHDYGFILPEGFVPFWFSILQRNHKRKCFKEFEADSCLVKASRKVLKDWSEPPKVFSGRIVSGDQAIFSPRARARLAEDFKALAVDMESAAVAQICKINMVPFLSIRAVSDDIDQSVHVERSNIDPQAFAEFCAMPECQRLSRPSQMIHYLARHPGRFMPARRAQKNIQLAAENATDYTLQLLRMCDKVEEQPKR
ncbi:5'-methylthioadenosine/S-adenosylhomocysteine nucleosidase [candidate division KSB3 bacterium]|uniref:adenosylhomocysteine nucleosidase n=1 Tax=candidate division KSB3 bacterium TaxID=2044937 RepID=A0A2G6E7L3_9BACT|nr:MAG: 5'-methylthioadenosine/S-adenosylhomocysteine nucleosidase [candidate division KSB3 bacterium]PIE30438.1 MAG: 5'-methylthioadenosine/S-adenosylhomocysteine nucleosidase [candidate division KSB3 bacterium]